MGVCGETYTAGVSSATDACSETGDGTTSSAGAEDSAAGATSSFLMTVFFGSAFNFFPEITPPLISILCTVRDGCAPLLIQYCTRSAFNIGASLCGLNVPSNSTYRPRFAGLRESVTITRNDGSFFRPILCSLIFSICAYYQRSGRFATSCHL